MWDGLEAFFGTQKRMSDYHFSRAATWPELHAVHARFFHDYNHQRHFAHEHRPKGRQSPAGVLGFVQGGWCDPADLDRLFRLRARRRVDRHGFVRYRHWRFYGERGLSGAEASVWVLGNDLTVEYAADTLAQYRVAYAQDNRAIGAVTEPRLFETRYPSPQPFLRAFAAVAWQPAVRLRPYRARLPRRPDSMAQAALFQLEGDQRDPAGGGDAARHHG